MKITLTTHSGLLAGSGEGDALIDADIVFNRQGFPFIPGKRLKGLLRESALEVGEITRMDVTGLINKLFGKIGDNRPAALACTNLYPSGYAMVMQELSGLPRTSRQWFTASAIKQYYTVERQQTALEPGGTAKPFSLRNYRVLKTCLHFEAEWDVSSLTDDLKALLHLAIVNLKHIGTRRNRGFGLVDIQLDTPLFNNAAAMAVLKNGVEKADGDIVAAENKKIEVPASEAHIEQFFCIKTISPVIIAQQRGEQNTVSAADYFPATAIRGMLAGRLLNQINQEDAHLNHLFHAALLDGSVIFKNAYPVANGHFYLPAPLGLQTEKGDSGKGLYNILEKIPVEKETANGYACKKTTRPAGGWLHIKAGNYHRHEPLKSFHFHNSRKDYRVEGKSEEGGIFYYESLEEGQVFQGSVYGPRTVIQQLKESMGSSFACSMGRSRSAQYGEVSFSFIDQPVNDPITLPSISEASSCCCLLLNSPAIVLNENGFPEPSLKYLLKYLQQHFAGNAIVSVNAGEAGLPQAKAGFIAGQERTENYLATWGAKTPAEPALAAGTSLSVNFSITGGRQQEFNQNLQTLQIAGIGERTYEGYGNISAVQLPAQLAYNQATEEMPGEVNRADAKDASLSRFLIEILQQKYEEQVTQRLQSRAMQNAERFNRQHRHVIKNHLAGRMEAMIGKALHLNNWQQQYLRPLANKEAGKTLEDAGLYKLLDHKFTEAAAETAAAVPLKKEISEMKGLSVILVEPSVFTNAQYYWTMFFKTLRKLNQQ